jgi:hypothetical protein
MKILYIGCRVKCVGKWTGKLPPPACMEGFIFCRDAETVGGLIADWGVDLDCGAKICCMTSDLEPILPSGHMGVSEEFLLTTIPELEQFIGVPA